MQSSDVVSSGFMNDRVDDLLEGDMFVKNLPLFSTLTWGEGGRGLSLASRVWASSASSAPCGRCGH